MNVRLTWWLRQLLDVLVLVMAYVAAYWLRFDRDIPTDALRQIAVTLPYIVGLKLALLGGSRMHRRSWRYTSLPDVAKVIRTMAIAAAVMLAFRLVAPELTSSIPPARYAAIPITVIISDFLLATFGLVGLRTLRRLQAESSETRARPAGSAPAKRVLLIGAGRAGMMTARELTVRRDLNMVPVGFVDDDPYKQGQLIHGLPVLGTTTDICALADDGEFDEAIITMASVDGSVVRRILEICKGCGLDPKIIPGIFEIVGGRVSLTRIRPVAIEDLLRRDPVELDVSSIRRIVQHEVVAVTGAGGSIGSELCRQVAALDPRELVLVEQAEGNLWAIHRELEAKFPGVTVVPRIADVCDAERMDQILLHHRPSTVFHAAAHKHVPMMEANPGEAIKNNVFGTKVVADLCLERGVNRFVLISTDKAVNPTSVMGATKRVAERYVQHLADRSGRMFVSVRFGNVLGSNGSVIPVFEEQIRNGGPITITHPEMRRYFMTIPEASQLVLQAAAIGSGGEIFTLDMGEPSRIVDLANDLIRLSGLTPGEDIQVEYTGARPGEKLFEELSLSEENAAPTSHPKIWVGQAAIPRWDTVADDLDALSDLIDATEALEVRTALKQVVPELTVEDVTGELPITSPDDASPSHLPVPDGNR